MKIRWSPEAATDFAEIVEYIRKQNPSAADRTAHTLYDSVTSLKSFPNRGRLGRVEDTREIVLAPRRCVPCETEHRRNCQGIAWSTTLAMNLTCGSLRHLLGLGLGRVRLDPQQTHGSRRGLFNSLKAAPTW